MRESAYRPVPSRWVFWMFPDAAPLPGGPDPDPLLPDWLLGRGLEDLLDRLVQRGVEIGVALLGGEPLGQGPGEAGDHALVLGQLLAGVVAGVPTRQGHHLDDLRMPDEVGVEVGLARDRQLEHDLLVVAQLLEPFRKS